MPKTKTKKRSTRRIKRTRRVMPRRKKTIKRRMAGGYDPASDDNSFYPTKMNGYPTMTNYALPDPKYIDHVTVDR
jgi:hypothetical protein